MRRTPKSVMELEKYLMKVLKKLLNPKANKNKKKIMGLEGGSFGESFVITFTVCEEIFGNPTK